MFGTDDGWLAIHSQVQITDGVDKSKYIECKDANMETALIEEAQSLRKSQQT